MKLKSFNVTNTANYRPRKAVLSIAKNGMFRFSLEAVEIMGLKAGDQVQFHQDENEPENWYVEAVKKDGFPLRAAYGDNGGLLINAAGIKRHIFESVNYTGEAGRLYFGEKVELQKKTLHTLITGFLRNV